MQESLMKFRSLIVGSAALAAVSLAPTKAHAVPVGSPPCFANTYSYILGATGSGLGASLQGCFTFTLTELGENAGGVGQQYYWTNANALLGTGAPNNAPTTPGTFFFDDDCGSSGVPGSANFRFCNGVEGPVKTTGSIQNLAGELVIGMLVHDLVTPPQNGGADYWIYSGNSARNAYPVPIGYQAVLYQLTSGGVVQDGEFLFAWEDVNTGCLAAAGAGDPSSTTFRMEDLTNKVVLDDPNNCVNQPGVEPDYNDSYIRLSIVGNRLDVVPEPMTMTLMATGFGRAGAQIRRRKNRK